jgi:acetyl esterase/lipase
MRRLLLAVALALVPTLAASEPDDLSYVNPELRGIAKAVLAAQANNPARSAPGPANPPPLPPGVSERQVPGAPKQPLVPVFVVNVDVAKPPRGAILFLHGGGYTGGDARDSLRSLATLAGRLDCVVVSVQYRVAPQTRFPGALEDNYAALKWLYRNAASLGVDPARLVVMGESAGGGHAAMLTIAARDRGEIPIAAQVLIYPMLDDRTGSRWPVPPMSGNLVWRPADNRKGWAALLGQPAGRSHVPAGSVPSRVRDLSRLPPTFIGVGSIDLFAQEDIDFAHRLIDAGVSTELLVVPGAFHAFQQMASGARVSRQFNAAIENALGRGVAGDARK